MAKLVALRPGSDRRLDDALEEAAFPDAWWERSSRDYLRREDGVTLSRFTRMFIIARRR